MISSIKIIKNLHWGVFTQISVSGFGQVIKTSLASASLSVKVCNDGEYSKGYYDIKESSL